MTRKGILNSED